MTTSREITVGQEMRREYPGQLKTSHGCCQAGLLALSDCKIANSTLNFDATARVGMLYSGAKIIPARRYSYCCYASFLLRVSS